MFLIDQSNRIKSETFTANIYWSSQSHIPSRLKQSAMEAPSSGTLFVSLTSMWLPCFIFFSHHFFSLSLRQVQMMGPNGGLYQRSWVMRVLYQVLLSCLLTVTWLTNVFFCCRSPQLYLADCFCTSEGEFFRGDADADADRTGLQMKLQVSS